MTVRAPGRPLVSVVIPAYNAGRYIDECLTSVLVQGGDLEVLVADDGSSDDTVARVRARGLPCVEQRNRGPAAARNAALARARGEYVAFLDSDDLWPAGKLSRQVALLEAHPDVGLVFGDCRQFDEEGAHPATLFEESGKDDAFWGDPVYVVRPYARLMEGNFITTGSVVMRRNCLERVGRFDEGLRLVEDLEFWLRVSLEYAVAHDNEVCLLRRRHGENTSRDQVAMSLAFLRVLREHEVRHARAASAQGAKLRPRILREYEELGHLYVRRQAYRDAARAYGRALRGRPRLRTLYYLLGALGAGVGRLYGAAR